MASDETEIEEAKPHVMFVTRKWPPAMGGMETYAVRLTDMLRQRCDLDIVALHGQPNGQPPGILALLGFPFMFLKSWFTRSRVPQVLHLCDMSLWPFGLIAWLNAGETRVVLSAHGTDAAYHRRGGIKGRLYGAYLRLGARMLRGADVVSNSHATAEVLEETGWASSAVVPLATDMRIDELPIGHNGSVLFAGRLIERKGCAWFIQNVLPKLPNGITLTVAGTGWDKDEKEALDNPRVNFLGPLSQPELAKAYRNAMCVVVPNIPVKSKEYEGFGLVASEAAAAGGVVLAAACDGLLDAVVEGTTGLLLEPGNAKVWATAIERIAAWDEQTRKDYVAQSSQVAAQKYNWKRVADETAAVYAT